MKRWKDILSRLTPRQRGQLLQTTWWKQRKENKGLWVKSLLLKAGNFLRANFFPASRLLCKGLLMKSRIRLHLPLYSSQRKTTANMKHSYACYNQKRTRYGVVSIPREILPELELEFERDMNFSRNTPPRFLGRQPQFKGFGPAFWESIGHVPVTIGHSGPPHAWKSLGQRLFFWVSLFAPTEKLDGANTLHHPMWSPLGASFLLRVPAPTIVEKSDDSLKCIRVVKYK